MTVIRCQLSVASGRESVALRPQRAEYRFLSKSTATHTLHRVLGRSGMSGIYTPVTPLLHFVGNLCLHGTGALRQRRNRHMSMAPMFTGPETIKTSFTLSQIDTFVKSKFRKKTV